MTRLDAEWISIVEDCRRESMGERMRLTSVHVEEKLGFRVDGCLSWQVVGDVSVVFSPWSVA